MEELRKGEPKLKKPDVIPAVEQKPNEDPSEFLGRIYLNYQKHTVADPQSRVNVQTVNVTSIGQSALDIRRKPQHLDGALGVNLSQLMDLAFKVAMPRKQRN